MPAITLDVKAPLGRRRLAELMRHYEELRSKWGLRHQMKVLRSGAIEPTYFKGDTFFHARSASHLFLSGFSSLIHENSRQGKATRLAINHNGFFIPLYAGEIPQGKGFEFAVGHFRLKGAADLQLPENTGYYWGQPAKEYMQSRVFVFLPDRGMPTTSPWAQCTWRALR